ncbi:Germin-like protein subfamily T member 2 [Linum grandiflorum]
MISHSSYGFTLCILILKLLLLPLNKTSADPDPLQDFCVADLTSTQFINGFPCKPATQVTSDDFFFDGLSKEGNTSNVFGSFVNTGNVLAFPGLNTLGLSMNRVDIAPGGLNPPHSHPRATEAGVVIQGKVLVGFVSTAGVYYSKVLNGGEMFVIPKGLVHFQMNVGDENAVMITSFNSQLPGAVVVPLALFAATPDVHDQVLAKSFLVGEDIVDSIKAKFNSSSAG